MMRKSGRYVLLGLLLLFSNPDGFSQGKKAYVEFRGGYFNATYKPDNENFHFYSCGLTYLRRVIRFSQSRFYFSADIHLSRKEQKEFYEGSRASFNSEILFLSFYWGYVSNYGNSDYFYDFGVGMSHIVEEVKRSTEQYSQNFLFPSFNSFQVKGEIGKGFYVNEKKGIFLVARLGINFHIFSRKYDRITFEELDKKEWVNIVGPKISIGIVI